MLICSGLCFVPFHCWIAFYHIITPFIHSTVDGHLGCFQLSVTINIAAMNNIAAYMSLGLHARVSLQNNASRWNRWFNSVWTSLASLDNAKLFSQLIVFLPVIYKSSDYSTVSPIPGLVSGHLSPELVKWKGVLMSFSMSNIHSLASFSLALIPIFFSGFVN